VATAYHCVTSGSRVRITERDGTVQWGRVTARSARHDLALITAEDASEYAAELGGKPLAQGERVVAVGHPLASEPPTGYLAGTLLWSVSEGVVSQVGDIAIQHTAPLAPGYSGGPLFNTEGQLVGIHSRRLGSPGLAFSTSVAHVSPLMERDAPRKGAWFGGSVAARPGLGVYGASAAATYFTLELEADIRERFWLRITGGAAGQDASAQWPIWEAAAGFRHTLGHGPYALSIDAGWSERLLSSRFYLTNGRDETDVPTRGFNTGLRFRGVGWRANWSPGGQWTGFNMTVDWPGKLTVY